MLRKITLTILFLLLVTLIFSIPTGAIGESLYSPMVSVTLNSGQKTIALGGLLQNQALPEGVYMTINDSSVTYSFQADNDTSINGYIDSITYPFDLNITPISITSNVPYLCNLNYEIWGSDGEHQTFSSSSYNKLNFFEGSQLVNGESNYRSYQNVRFTLDLNRVSSDTILGAWHNENMIWEGYNLLPNRVTQYYDVTGYLVDSDGTYNFDQIYAYRDGTIFHIAAEGVDGNGITFVQSSEAFFTDVVIESASGDINPLLTLFQTNMFKTGIDTEFATLNITLPIRFQDNSTNSTITPYLIGLRSQILDLFERIEVVGDSGLKWLWTAWNEFMTNFYVAPGVVIGDIFGIIVVFAVALAILYAYKGG